MRSEFKGKVAVVTGGGSGIGRASAMAFARVVAADWEDMNGMETVRLIKEERGEAIFVRTDVSKSVEVEALIREQ